MDKISLWFRSLWFCFMIFLTFHGPLSVALYWWLPQISLDHVYPLTFSAFRFKSDEERPLLIYVLKIEFLLSLLLL